MFLLDSGDGGAAREAYRRFVAITAAYLAEVLAAEASAKFETPVNLSFERLRGTDRAVKALVDGGATYEDAIAQAGLG